MNNLQLVKQAKFNGIEADFYSNEKEVFMTANQLGECLGYREPTIAVNKIVNRNGYLKNKEFSVLTKLVSTDGKQYNTRVFTEDGIYEVTMLSKTQAAKEFRAWVRSILKSLRKGDTKIVSMTEYQRLMTQTRAENAKIRKAKILTDLAKEYNGTYRQVLQSYATKELTGEHLLPLPQLGQKTYTATELGERLGISANMVGILTNRHNLKTNQYGAWFNDTAKKHHKEVQSFRYYESVIPVLQKLLKAQAV